MMDRAWEDSPSESVCLLNRLNVEALQSERRLRMTFEGTKFSQPAEAEGKHQEAK